MATKDKKRAVRKKRTATKRKPTNKRKQQKKSVSPIAIEIIGLIAIFLAIVMIFEFDPVGRILSNVTRFFFGNWHLVIPLLIIYQAVILMVKREINSWKNRLFFGSLFILASLLLFSHIFLFEQLQNSRVIMTQSSIKQTWEVLISNDAIALRNHSLGGGMIGAFIYAMFFALFDMTGAKVMGVLLLLIGVILITGKALMPYLIEKTPLVWQATKERIASLKSQEKVAPKQSKREALKAEKRAKKPEVLEEAMGEEAAAPIISTFKEQIEKDALPVSEVVDSVEKEEAVEREEVTSDVQDPVMDSSEALSSEQLKTYRAITGEAENKQYILPSVSLLTETPDHDQSAEYDSIQANAKKLESTLLSFGVKTRVAQVHLGPAVTKYEVLPDVGVKVSRIVSLTDDLALALAASDIRIEAPIPGKSAIGIEVPNTNVAVVSLREVIESKENNDPDAKLLISLGRDVTGKAILTELNKTPHLLVAGATGSGKSVCINGIIMSILLRAKPHEVKLMMIDPKMVELNVYNGIPHLLAPVVTDPRKAAQALQKVVAEMERRYELFSHTGTRNIEGYNAHIETWNEEQDEKHPKMPYIVVIVDELADLMMVASNDVEDAITRLAQMARAAGIHLIIATQRPSVDVITGVIKANIPSRIAFSVSSAVDSRTILDTNGADKLLGRGDMLFLHGNASKPIRVQGAFVSDREVEEVVDFVIEQQKAQYQEEMIPTEVVEVPPHEETDDLYDEAVQLVVDMQTASVSMLQRRFRVGYSRAARIVDQMEARGVVGPPEGSKPRKVLIGKDELDTE